jgi:hypothetical protein
LWGCANRASGSAVDEKAIAIAASGYKPVAATTTPDLAVVHCYMAIVVHFHVAIIIYRVGWPPVRPIDRSLGCQLIP